MFNSLQIPVKQLWWAMAISTVTVFLTFIPIIYGQINTADKFFTGKTVNTRYDLPTYLAWIEQGREGKVLFSQLYTTEIQPAIFFHPFFLATGIIADQISITNFQAYQGLRAISTFVFLLITFLLISKFLFTGYERILALILVCTSSGLGFLFNPENYPIWLYEFNTFTDISNTVLDPIGLSLVFGTWLLALQYFSLRNWKVLGVAIILVNLLAITHTYDLVLLFGVGFAYASWQFIVKRDKFTIINFLYLLLFTFPGLYWQIHVLSTNTTLGVWAFLQSDVVSANLWILVIQYGLVLMFALLGLLLAFNSKKKNFAFLSIWLILGFALIYSPVLANYQRKFGIGYHVVLSIFSAYLINWALVEIVPTARKFLKISLTVLVVVCLSTTNIVTIGLLIKYFYTDQPRPYYISTSENEALSWLRDNAVRPASVLADYELSNLVPGVTGLSVYSGHYDQTVNIDLKYNIAILMLGSKASTTDPLKSFLHSENIRYIIIGLELNSTGGFDSENRPYLSLIYSNNDAQIYEVE